MYMYGVYLYCTTSVLLQWLFKICYMLHRKLFHGGSCLRHFPVTGSTCRCSDSAAAHAGTWEGVLSLEGSFSPRTKSHWMILNGSSDCVCLKRRHVIQIDCLKRHHVIQTARSDCLHSHLCSHSSSLSGCGCFGCEGRSHRRYGT